MGEIEAQPVRGDERALLRDMIAENLAQRLVQKMRRRMIGPYRAAAGMIDVEFDRQADRDEAALDDAIMDEKIAELLLRIGHAEARGSARGSKPVSPTWPPDSP